MRKSVPEDAAVGSRLRLARFLSSNKPFIVVWLALFISIAGIGMVSPLLPVFAEDMGASGIWLGLAFSGFAITQVPLMPVVGRLSDRFGKKFFLWFGLLIYTIAAAGYFWSPGYQELVLFRLVSGVGAAMVIPTAFAYVGELAPSGYEGRYMGLFNMALIAGFGIGPVLGGTIHDSLGMDATFVSMGMLSTIGMLIVFLLLPARTSSPGVVPSPGVTKPEEPSTSFASMLRDETMRGVVTFQLVFGLSFGAVLAFLGIFMMRVMDTSVAQVGIMLSIRTIFNGTLAYPFGLLADRMKRVILISAGMVVMATGTFSIPWVGSFTLLLGLFMVMGIFESMAMPSVNALAVEKGRSMGMGSVMGVFNMALSLGLVIGSLAGGVIESSVGIGWVFRCAAALSFVGVVVFNVFMRRSARLSKEPLAVLQPSALDSAFSESADARDKQKQ
ncbi:MFS transporter [Chloroflexota bacterium]